VTRATEATAIGGVIERATVGTLDDVISEQSAARAPAALAAIAGTLEHHSPKGLVLWR
jgi:hypothetical protein